MSTAIQQTSQDYKIVNEPIEGLVRAYHDRKLIAESTNAVVMHETRLDPVIYFPKNDVLGALEQNAAFNTFCPFKGTASYYDLSQEKLSYPKAAWSYERALPESKGVEGLVAFLPDFVTKIETPGTEIVPMNHGNISGPTVDWVMREAWLCKTPQELTAAIARKFVEDGIAISRLSVMIWSLHPLIIGRHYVWNKETDTVETHSPSHDILEREAFVNSPIRHVSNGLGGVRQRLDAESPEFSFPIMDELRENGATDYVAMPLPFSNGLTNVLALTCDHPKGFTTPNLGLVFECSTVISRYYEVFTSQENARSLLETYLGKRTGARVLGGEIRRGDGDDIEAAILFCDLRHSTRLQEQMGREAFIDLLNRFFEHTSNIVETHDGEVLKFIGDAILAIFPATASKSDACEKARVSAQEIVRTLVSESGEEFTGDLDCSIGIAYGDVTYGNIGSRERLDFTVIGPAANVAARLGDFGKAQNHRIVATDDIVAGSGSSHPLGELDLRNVGRPVHAHAIDIENID